MTFRFGSSRSGILFLASFLALPVTAGAADLPPIKASETNKVAACATPGRLMAYLRERNTKLDPRYDTLAREYARHGEALAVRWDYAFFQMILETGYLAYGGDVKANQNNFAGLGATGKGARGESFPDVSTGARAHIEHLVMYSGERVENPVAERTRNIQDWGVLTSWQQGISGPITFAQLAKKWAPGSRRYVADIAVIAERFFEGPCKGPDPEADLIASESGPPVQMAAAETPAPGKTRGLEAQRRAIEAAKAEGTTGRSSLGGVAATEVAAAASGGAAPAQVQAAAMSPPITLLNPAGQDAPAAKADAKADAPAQAPAKAEASVEVAALPGGGGAIKDGTKKAEKKAPASKGNCRVWTASYGGSKAIIIKAMADKTVNYTVLDVNEGAEKREADAYINAYAKGGQSVGEFQSQSQALEKAFELCPEG